MNYNQIEAGTLKKGDVLIWNFGITETVDNITKETNDSILVKTIYRDTMSRVIQYSKTTKLYIKE